MKLISTIVLVLLFTSVSFADWYPPHNPNPHGILIEAREDTRNKRFESALKKHIWFHQNALKYDPALYGVRLSFALSDWLTLGQVYEPALEQLKNVRNEAEKKVKSGIDSYEFFHDFVSINSDLEDNQRTVLLFKWLDINKPILAQKVFKIAKPILLNAKERTIYEKYIKTEVTSFVKDRPSNELPMYGGQDKSHIQPNTELSQNASDIGWEYLMKGDVDTAIKRFNQSWMFNHNNVDALWGFGIVTLHRGNILKENSLFNLEESVKYLEMAKSIKPEELRLIVDLSLSYIFLGNELKKDNKQYRQYFYKAEKNLNNAIIINEEYPMIYANYSVLEYYSEDYSKSKKYLEKAKSLGFKIDPLFEKKLNGKL